MKRVCVIGDSHLAAMKLGWDFIGNEHPDIALTFFGSPQRNLQDLRIENGALVPGSKLTLEHIKFTSQGESKISVGDFDAFLIVALQFSIVRIVSLYMEYRAEEHKNFQGAKHYVSDACFMHAARGLMQKSLAVEIAEKLKTLTDQPIMIMPQPFPAERIVSVLPFWKPVVDHGDYVSLVRCFDRIILELTGAGKRFLRQPDETKTDGLFTKHKYTEGSVRLTAGYDVRHPEDDCWHMNQTYGEVVLRSVIPVI